MASKIIQKEKERQDKILKESTAFMGDSPEDPQPFQYNSPAKLFHKQSLINLKEYMEGVEFYINDIFDSLEEKSLEENNVEINIKKSQLKEDIEELNKMVERYD